MCHARSRVFIFFFLSVISPARRHVASQGAVSRQPILADIYRASQGKRGRWNVSHICAHKRGARYNSACVLRNVGIGIKRQRQTEREMCVARCRTCFFNTWRCGSATSAAFLLRATLERGSRAEEGHHRFATASHERRVAPSSTHKRLEKYVPLRAHNFTAILT